MIKPAQPATPLPWYSADEYICSQFQNMWVADCWPVNTPISRDQSHQNAAYIVEACDSYPRLLQEREKLIETVDTLIAHAKKSHGSDAYYVEIKKAQALLSEIKQETKQDE